MGVYLTVTMLFKINTLEVAVDGEVVQEVGGYSSAEILQALGVHAEENIFSFDPAEKAAALEKQFPLQATCWPRWSARSSTSPTPSQRASASAPRPMP